MNAIDPEHGARSAATAPDEDAIALNDAARDVARTMRRASLSPAEPAMLAALLDLVAVTLAFAVAAPEGAGVRSLASGLGCALIAFAVTQSLRGYRLAALRRYWRGLVTLGLAAALAFGLGRLAGWTTAVPLPLAALVLLFGGAARGLARVLCGWVLGFGLTERRAMVIGGGPEAERLIAGLAANPDNDIRIRGVFDDRADGRSPPAISGVPRLGTTRELLAFARAAEMYPCGEGRLPVFGTERHC